MYVIIVLSGPGIIFGDKLEYELTNDIKSRLDNTIKVWEQLKGSKIIIVTGGNGGKRPYASSTIMKKYLIKYSIPSKYIFEESWSLNTAENAILTKYLISDLSKNGTPIKTDNDTYEYLGVNTDIHLITSNYHLTRASMIFRHYYGEQFSIHFHGCESDDTGIIDQLQNEIKSISSLKLIYEKYPINWRPTKYERIIRTKGLAINTKK